MSWGAHTRGSSSRANAQQAAHALPLDVVLPLLFDQANALEHVGNVVDAALLHLEHRGGLVQVEKPLGRFLDQVDELLGQQPQRAAQPLQNRMSRGNLLLSESDR